MSPGGVYATLWRGWAAARRLLWAGQPVRRRPRKETRESPRPAAAHATPARVSERVQTPTPTPGPRERSNIAVPLTAASRAPQPRQCHCCAPVEAPCQLPTLNRERESAATQGEHSLTVELEPTSSSSAFSLLSAQACYPRYTHCECAKSAFLAASSDKRRAAQRNKISTFRLSLRPR